MSDSEDDWFEKDIDDIVQEMQKKKDHMSAPVYGTETEPSQSTQKFSYESGYGGNYVVPNSNPDVSTNNKNKFHHSKKGFTQSASYTKLNFIAEQPPLQAFMEVTQSDCGFFESCSKKSKETVVVIMKIFAKLCELPLIEFKKEFLLTFVHSDKLLQQIGVLIEDVVAPRTKLKMKKVQFHINKEEAINYLITICKDIQLFDLMNDSLKSLLQRLENQKDSDVGELFDLKHELSSIAEADSSAFRVSKEIYPTLEELKSSETIDLKPNIVKGKFNSVQEYLDVHLALLREDFVSPLRDFIAELRLKVNLDKIPSRVYKKTKFLLSDVCNVKNRKGEMLLVDFKSDQRDEIKGKTRPESTWINPKKLMFGTLLCFTSSLEFNDLILAVVSNRDPEMLLKGYIQVEIVKMYDIQNIYNREFIMFENEVYFEPYHHVHRVLRGLNKKTFPMSDFIVDIEMNNIPPDYLREKKAYEYTFKKNVFNPLDPTSYPTDMSLHLNPSQLQAYQQSLSRRFSLIQGPPGTGKTYIGLQLVATLLQNVDAQILIICYTNHALDQFLSGILPITKDIVRMGNQSKHEKLDEYNIKQIGETMVADRRLRACFYTTKGEYSEAMQEFEMLQNEPEKDENCWKKIFELQKEMRRISAKLDEIKQICDYTFIKDKKVIGMTTTCAARCNLLLQLLKTPIVIVEEAAEILESHIIASLTKETQHVILIGDHQQLRPTTSVYRLSEKFKLDISLFERMVNNNLNCVCLSTQHRMRPEIADLIRPQIYNHLEDHESVKKYESIRGVNKNMFFINHNFKESKLNDETTKRNIHEAQFLLSFANYLLMQNYNPKDIVILTAYNGQMYQLFNERKNFPSLQKVRITVVDNFQGEESKIILLSLVRNNKENHIGYLARKNRICVALSRAREGLYVIGNFDFLARNNNMWNAIRTKVIDIDALGDAIPLRCERHGTITNVKDSAEFKSLSMGGCQCSCDAVLSCGHTCQLKCHWNGIHHKTSCECIIEK